MARRQRCNHSGLHCRRLDASFLPLITFMLSLTSIVSRARRSVGLNNFHINITDDRTIQPFCALRTASLPLSSGSNESIWQLSATNKSQGLKYAYERSVASRVNCNRCGGLTFPSPSFLSFFFTRSRSSFHVHTTKSCLGF